MSHVILYTHPTSGALCIVDPGFFDHARDSRLTAAECLAYVIEKDVPPGVPHRVCDTTDIPTDRIFREAFEDSGAAIEINMPKARDIHMDCIRKVRNAELVKLDVLSLRAQEANDATEKTRIASEKQTLRDIPQTFDLSTHVTPKALHDAWPDGLPEQ